MTLQGEEEQGWVVRVEPKPSTSHPTCTKPAECQSLICSETKLPEFLPLLLDFTFYFPSGVSLTLKHSFPFLSQFCLYLFLPAVLWFQSILTPRDPDSKVLPHYTWYRWWDWICAHAHDKCPTRGWPSNPATLDLQPFGRDPISQYRAPSNLR